MKFAQIALMIGASAQAVGLTNNHLVLGDSISTEPYSDLNWCGTGGYVKKFSDSLGITLNPQAVSSTVISQQMPIFFAQSSVPHDRSMSAMIGLNNIRYEDSAKTNAMIIGGLTSWMALHYAASFKEFWKVTDFTRAGTGWVTGSSGIPRRSNAWIASNVVNDTLTGTINGDAIAIGTYVKNIACGDFEVRVDGDLKYTFTQSQLCTTIGLNSGGEYYSNVAFILMGLGAGPHVLEIKISSISAGNYVFLDYVAEPQPFNSASTKPFVYLEIPHMNPAAYPTGSPYNNATTIGINNLNSLVWSDPGIQFFTGYGNFRRVITNSVYDPFILNNQVYSDGIHPNCVGSQNIANGVINSLS